MDAELRRLIRTLRKQGATVANGGKHTKVYRGADLVMVLPRAELKGNIHRWQNMVAELRRSGFKV